MQLQPALHEKEEETEGTESRGGAWSPGRSQEHQQQEEPVSSLVWSLFLSELPFFSAAGAFAAMAIIGYTTKTDLTKFGSLLYMAFIGIFIAVLFMMDGFDLCVQLDEGFQRFAC